MDRISHTFYTEPAPEPDTRVKPGGTPIADDEPYFTIRGNDRFALPMLKAYFEAVRIEASTSFLDDLRQIHMAFEAYQATHPDKVKTPD